MAGLKKKPLLPNIFKSLIIRGSEPFPQYFAINLMNPVDYSIYHSVTRLTERSIKILLRAVYTIAIIRNNLKHQKNYWMSNKWDIMFHTIVIFNDIVALMMRSIFDLKCQVKKCRKMLS